mmetsp:Transcript_36029/g.92083  ORF Transcript_36029/g.92083 Transcript_36029/m.92083 type:complete len:293 (-) Transcript_36029:132-1010(-)|eukprot:jgi/Tetstr1/421435/TSEL_012384.t1
MDSYLIEQHVELEVDDLLLTLVEDAEVVLEGFLAERNAPAAAQGELSDQLCKEEDWTCAICLDSIALAETAIVKGCGHLYCVGCILKWSLVKEDKVTCPKCKAPFNFLYTYRALDGTLNDFPQEESVVLLQRAVWFEESLGNFKGKGIAFEPEFDVQDWLEEECFEYDEDDDDDTSQYFMNSSGRRSRVMIGNRRWGSNGYIQSGRMAARPVDPGPHRPSKAHHRVASKDINLEPARGRRGVGSRVHAGAEPFGTSPPQRKEIPGMPPPEPSPAGKGRRARRARKRAAVDEN